MKKRKRLSNEIARVFVIAMAVSMIVLMVGTAVISKVVVENLSFSMLEEKSSNNAGTIENVFTAHSKGTRGLVDAVSGLSDIPEEKRERFVDNALSRYINSEIQYENSAIYGVFCEFEPYMLSSKQEGFTSYYYYEDGETGHETVTPDDELDYSREEYYTVTKAKNAVTVSEPYIYEFDSGESAMMVTITCPIQDKSGKFIGLVGTDILLNTLSQKLAADNDVFKNYYSYVVSPDKVCAAHSFNEKELGEIIRVPSAKVDGKDNLYYGTCEISHSDSYVASKEIEIDGAGTGWYSYVSVSESDVTSVSGIIAIIVFGFGALITIVLTIMISSLLKKRLKPVSEVVTAVDELSAGNLNVSVNVRSNDEIGEVSEKINSLISSLRSYIGEIADVVRNISDGNLNIKTSDNYSGDFIEIKHSLDLIIDSLNGSLSNINESSGVIKNNISQISLNSNMLAHSSEEEAADADKLVKIIGELSKTTQLNSENAKSIDALSNRSKEAAIDGNETMKELVGAMNQISVDSDEIAKIVKAIDDIAFQTNILALNASVEAARAGKYGKGFAVVADEVGNLAHRSAEASSQTAQLVANSQKNVSKGVSLAKRTAENMDSIAEEIEKVVQIAGDISTSVGTQAESIQSVNEFIGTINQNLQNNVAATEENAASINNLLSQTTKLEGFVSKYNLGSDE